MSDNVSLDWNLLRDRAASFSIKYKNAKKEASDKQLFWADFMAIFDVDAREVGTFEYYIKTQDGYGEIDYFWPGKLLIEHKSAGKDLGGAISQAIDYLVMINTYNQENTKRTPIPSPRYVIVSDFKTIILLDTIRRDKEITIELNELASNIEVFGFLANYINKRIEGQHPVNVKAAEVMGKLYDMLVESKYPEEKIDVLLIRLVFLLFAEDAEIFRKNEVSEYLVAYTRSDGSDMGSTLSELFSILNTPIEERQKTLPPMLMDFPYVNGGLFAENLPIPYFNAEMRNCFFEAATLDWRYISPAIFGSLFQCVMDPNMRRELGAHYTSEENILKLINSMFMDDLRKEFEIIKGNRNALSVFRKKLSEIRIIDPACGCGNFLIIAYREMRFLEMDVIKAQIDKMILNETDSTLYIDHYYGIEICKFPAMIANLSIILMDHIMNLESRNRFVKHRDIIPLKEKANIICANSLHYNWDELVDPSKLTYIVGNPPFVGAKLQTPEQRNELLAYFKKNAGIMDYVSAWYVKAFWMMQKNKKIRAGFVSTNSITQGEQVEPLWKPLFDKGININFAFKTFKWSNEAKGVAAVHVVIIGFSFIKMDCTIYTHSEKLTGTVIKNPVDHINAYLVNGPDIFLFNRSTPISDVPILDTGCQPIDDGNYLFSKEEKENFVIKEPASEQYFKKWKGAKEFINNIEKYCLWLGDCKPSELRNLPECYKRVEAVRKFRQSSKRKQTLQFADKPTRFYLETIPHSDFIAIPETSSEKREYIPIGFLDSSYICGNSMRLMQNAKIYHFGIIVSKMHMLWTNYVCGRLESRYRYSVGIVYNNFPWPTPSEKQIEKIEKAAQNILDIRKKYSDQSYADLYDPLTTPPDLLKAHHDLDKAVENAYSDKPFENDDERISFLFEKYSLLTQTLSESQQKLTNHLEID